MIDNKNIVVALDFSPSSRDALRQAQRIACWSGAALRAIHVVDAPAFTPAPPVLLPFVLPTQTDLVAMAKHQLEEFKKGLDGELLPEVEFRIGSPAIEIASYARGADLLVMGTHSVDDERRGIGTIASACVRRADCKVLLVRRGQKGPFRKVAAFVDFADTSREVLEKAIRVAARDGAALSIVHVYDDPWAGRSPRGAVADTMPEFRVKYREAVEERLRQFCEPVAHEASALKAVFRAIEHNRGWEGYAWGLVRFIHDEEVDLAVLGTRNTWNPRDFLMGSTAERVVRDARCSIVALKGAPSVTSAGAELKTPG
ncbi:MAG: universal stress protein [Phycisphaerales bacterium]|nr:universal stress protein [Phycisphaerales bacterium]